MASSPAVRATALLTPEATPAWLAGADISTAAVSGATVSVRPTPNTSTAGSTSVHQLAPGPIRSISTSPPADTSGPPVMNGRGPRRAAAAPTRADPASISAVTGSSVAPETIGLNPHTSWSCSTSRKKVVEIAAYTTFFLLVLQLQLVCG